MKKSRLLALFIVFSLIISIYPVMAQEENGDPEDIDYQPFISYYCGRLVWQGEEDQKPVIDEVVLKLSGFEYKLPIDEDGYFEMEWTDAFESAIVSIELDGYIIADNVPIENNIVFPSFTNMNPKKIYFSKINVINGRVANYNATSFFSDVVVTCYRRIDGTNDWALWQNDILSPSPVRITDTEGRFSYQVVEGEYQFTVKLNGYEDYNSFDFEYSKNGISLISTLKGGTLNPILHLSNHNFLYIMDTYPKNNQTVSQSDEFYILFNKTMLQKPIDDKTTNLRLQVENSGSIVPCTITAVGEQIKIKPKAKLLNGVRYKLVATVNLKAMDGTSLSEDYVVSFLVSSQVVDNNNQTEPGDNELDEPQEDEQPNVDKPMVDMEDINEHWAKEYIQTLIQKGIISGNEQPDGSLLYFPENEISRQEFAKLIVLSIDITAYPMELPFADTAQIADWAKPYILAAYEEGLIKGVEREDGLLYFEPDAAITRAEIMTIIGRIFGADEAVLDYADWDEVPDWAKPYVAACVEKKLVSGYLENEQQMIKPLNNITRAEAATIIAKLMDANTDASDDIQEQNETDIQGIESNEEEEELIDSIDTDNLSEDESIN